MMERQFGPDGANVTCVALVSGEGNPLKIQKEIVPHAPQLLQNV